MKRFLHHHCFFLFSRPVWLVLGICRIHRTLTSLGNSSGNKRDSSYGDSYSDGFVRGGGLVWWRALYLHRVCAVSSVLAPSDNHKVSRRRRLAFAALTVVLLLGLAEVVMHTLAPEGAGREQGFVGHSTAVPYFVTKGDRWVPNRSEMSRYTSLPVSREAGGFRVGVFGGSTVARNPPDGPVWQFAAMLKLGFGGDTQVLNGGGHGFGSTRVRGAMIESLSGDLDAVILYTGHNEFTESRYVPTLSLQGGVGGLIQSLARNSRIYEALRLGVRDAQGQAHAVSSQVPGGSLRRGEMARLEARFRDNLVAIADAMKARGVLGVWVLPASNLGMAPEASMGGQALAHFERGRQLVAQGEKVSALSALRQARDADQVPRRATSGLVKIMTQVANQYQIPLVDAEAVLFKRDPFRTLAGGFSPDRMHLSAVGYRLVMAEVYAVLSRTMQQRPTTGFHLRPMTEFAAQLPAPGASLAPVLGRIERTVTAPTLGELEHKPRDKALTGGR
jgi:lysophospholipase L1-like esterase